VKENQLVLQKVKVPTWHCEFQEQDYWIVMILICRAEG